MEAFKGQLDRARRGEPEALSALYRQLLPGVFGYIAARVPERATAEDLTSDVFLQMVESISRLRANDEASVAAWILQIARVTVAGYYRKRAHQPAFVSLEPREEEPGASWGSPTTIPTMTLYGVPKHVMNDSVGKLCRDVRTSNDLLVLQASER